MTLFVDTSVWSLALRRDWVSSAAEVVALRQALEGGDTIVTTGLILQELLQGFAGARAHKAIVERFSALPSLNPERQDHIDAAVLPGQCRRARTADRHYRSVACSAMYWSWADVTDDQ